MSDDDYGHDEADERVDGEGEVFEGKTKSSRRWLAQIEDAESAFKDWQSKADNIDKLYANLNILANDSRDRQFQMFWANIQVLGPSIYARPPIPVVTPRFKDRKPVPRVASELLERSTIVSFELQDIDATMRQVRDDLTVQARGCAWVRYEANEYGKGQQVCIEHADRKDFLTNQARTWKEVDIVAKRSWLTKPKMRQRFYKHSGDAYKDASYEYRKTEDGEDDTEKTAGVWEIWCKSKNRVVWVTEGVDVCLDEDKPHLTLEGFFPCPRPAYSTLQRRSLIPVPDMLFYKDQLEEINELTARIGALSDALQVRGFYPAGAGEIGDAIEAAIKSTTDNQVLVPVSNWSLMGGSAAKDMIVWLPIDQVATTIVQLVELRKQLIADVYEITGLSDIMRGSTDANETLGAQELKSQYGSVRIRDRQNELARFARDLVRLTAEIMAENFSAETLLEMSQLEVETDADIAQQIKAIEAQIMQIVEQVEAAKTNPQMMQQAQANPEQAQQMLQQAKQQAEGLKGQIEKLKEQPTIEKVMKLLRDQRGRPYVLDIETDSTIAPDENAQKQRATEFMTAMGGYINQVGPQLQVLPQLAPLAAEGLKYVASQFRAGRQMEGVIEEFADQMKAMAGQPKPPAPEQIKAQSEAQSMQADAMEKQANAQKVAQETQSKAANEDLERRVKEQEALRADEARQIEIDGKRRINDMTLEQMTAKRADEAQKHAQEMDLGTLAIEKLRLEIEGVKTKTAATVASTEAKIEQTNTQTDNSIRATDASVQATADNTAIKADAARAKAMEPA